MGTIFMNSENSKTSEPNILKLKLTDKLDVRLDKKVNALSNVSMYYTWNNIRSLYNNNKLKIHHQHGMKNLHYQTGLILYQIFKIIFNIF